MKLLRGLPWCHVVRAGGRGVRVRILAPSLGADNQALVHGHYKKFRKPIVDAGAELYEMRRVRTFPA